MWNIFKSEKSTPPIFKTDLHSHLLPSLDDGVKSFDESLKVIETFLELGFTKAITTPHIMNDYYRNDPQSIRSRLEELKKYLTDKSIPFTIEAAAEYYFDESFLELVQSGNELLTFHDNYVLFETNTFSEPMLLNDLIFQLKVKNLKPVLAHPERYQYLQNNLTRIEDLIDRGVYMQVNALSLIGFYSKPIQQVATQLVEKKMVHFLGSDCHTFDHSLHLKKCIAHKNFKKALELPLLNYSI